MAHLGEAGEEGLDGQGGTADFEVVVSQASGHPNGGHHSSLKALRQGCCHSPLPASLKAWPLPPLPSGSTSTSLDNLRWVLLPSPASTPLPWSYLFALPTDQRKPEILQLDLFVGPGEGGVEEASPRHQRPSPLGATPLTQNPKRDHILPTPSLAQPPASTLLLVRDWLCHHGNGPSSEKSVTSPSCSGPDTASSDPVPWTELCGGTRGV